MQVHVPHAQYFPGGSDGKASAYNAGDPGLIPGLGRSPGEGTGTPLQYSCLGNPRDEGAWQATVYGIPKSRTRLSNFTFTFHMHSKAKQTKMSEFGAEKSYIAGPSKRNGWLVFKNPELLHDSDEEFLNMKNL